MRTRFVLLLLGYLALSGLALAVLAYAPLLPRPGPRWPEEALAAVRADPWRPVRLLVRPSGSAEERARWDWLYLQLPLAGLAGAYLLAVAPAPAGSGNLRLDPRGTHGSARWRTRRELTRTLLPVSLPSRGSPPAGLVIASEPSGRACVRAWVLPWGRYGGLGPHVLVIGASGSGKTRRLIVPALLYHAVARSHSLVVVDPKGELYATTAGLFHQAGYKVLTLNLVDPPSSDRYNPLHAVTDAFQARDHGRAAAAAWDLAQAVVSNTGGESKIDPFWSNAEQALIAALALYVADQAPPEARCLATAYRLLIYCGADGGDTLDAVMAALPPDHPAQEAYGVVRLSIDRTRSGIFTGAAARLRLWSDPQIAAMTAGSDYPLDLPGRELCAVYLIIPDDRGTRESISSMWLTQTYEALLDLARRNGGRLPVPVCFLLDEFPNVGVLPDWDKKVATMRGRGMQAVHVIQSWRQLEARYGPKGVVIAANCDTWTFLRANDPETARVVSEKTGQATVRTETVGQQLRGGSAGESWTQAAAGRPLLTPDEVMRWPAGQALILQAGEHPAKLPLTDFSRWPGAGRSNSAPASGPRAPHPPVPFWLPSLHTPHFGTVFSPSGPDQAGGSTDPVV